MQGFSLTVGQTTWSVSNAISQPWYQSGDWPLIGAISALAITNAVAIFIALYQQNKNRQLSEDFARREQIENSLAEFYDPILALLSENREIFQNFGPQRIAKLDNIDASAAAKVWSEMKTNFILNNNEQMSSIISTKSHLISEEDEFQPYLKLKLHIDSYSVFLKIGSEVHQRFKFPTDIEERVRTHRKKQIQKLMETRR